MSETVMKKSEDSNHVVPSTCTSNAPEGFVLTCKPFFNVTGSDAHIHGAAITRDSSEQRGSMAIAVTRIVTRIRDLMIRKIALVYL